VQGSRQLDYDYTVGDQVFVAANSEMQAKMDGGSTWCGTRRFRHYEVPADAVIKFDQLTPTLRPRATTK
jgi:hypothetical protein